jgi:murein DD-endopeptidase MepM/ murein hydrolase activator NlpD
VWMLLVAVSFLAPGGPTGPSVCLLAPVSAPIVDPFRAPGCQWCPGNRGLQYAVAAGTPVRAAAAGMVSFSGVVAGTRYVVVEHAAGGLRATYGGLAETGLREGDVVAAGSVVGVAGGEGLHFGLRRGEVYVDPAPLLGRLVERPRLVPTDGTPRRAAPPPQLRCPAATAASLAAVAGGSGPR